MLFTTAYLDILEQIKAIDPIEYAKTRNYLSGAVTKLSPYISRGVISTKQVAQMVFSKGFKPNEIQSFLKELAWRDYFQQVWLALGDDINKDIKQIQPDCHNQGINKALTTAKTGIIAIDEGIETLKKTGYMHNHIRMYVASLACNVGKIHWFMPAQWMYYYLLDADWASNALSWQWVAGSFSSKKYYANQENINKFCGTNQSNTFLDVPYENFPELKTPEILTDITQLDLQTKLPMQREFSLNRDLPTYIYNFYNLDCKWNEHINANRVLLLEPSFFKKYPVSEETMAFILGLSNNIKNIQVYIGEFDDLHSEIGLAPINFKEHPTANHYKGFKHSRDWMFNEIQGNYPSFFAYWKKCQPYFSSNFSY